MTQRWSCVLYAQRAGRFGIGRIAGRCDVARVDASTSGRSYRGEELRWEISDTQFFRLGEISDTFEAPGSLRLPKRANIRRKKCARSPWGPGASPLGWKPGAVAGWHARSRQPVWKSRCGCARSRTD